MSHELYPLFLKLDGYQTLVVGAGSIAYRKIMSLLKCGAKVHVVAPNVHEKIAKLAESGKIDLSSREFEESDVGGQRIIIAATSSSSVNEVVKFEAEKAGILINVVDVPDLCDFYVPAVVQRSPLQIAISTAGAAPALARILKNKLESEYPEGISAYIKLLGTIREKVKLENPHKVTEIAEALAASKAFDLWLSGDEAAAKTELDDLVNNIVGN